MKRLYRYSYKFFPLFLLLIYLISPLRVIQPFLNYEINYDYISKVLCINKSKPKMECNGKCHLKKELKKQTENNSENQTVNLKLTISEELSENNITLERKPVLLLSGNLTSFCKNIFSDPLLREISLPPES